MRFEKTLSILKSSNNDPKKSKRDNEGHLIIHSIKEESYLLSKPQRSVKVENSQIHIS